MEIGFTFLMDYNEDRQVKFEVAGKEKKEDIDLDMARNILKLDHNDDAVIHFNSIGKDTRICVRSIHFAQVTFPNYRAGSCHRRGRIQSIFT